MEILLDTNFILTCVLQKIDFVELSEEMFNEKLNWILPKQVISELKKIEKDLKQKRKFREGAKLSLEILETMNLKIVDLNKNPNIDIAIKDYIFDKPIVLATNDKGLKKRVKNRILSIRGTKSLILECNNS
ncbi:MAG: hypothetical protein PHX15_03060 [Candidatus Nanoarchaeia archaeon]|nr:hypothetical protein [Candidatus Nanoarchaeia archaeon]MDD3994149.1 hypothetical protein [Candidatus Nanoarchaeia archaeon]MDD4563721.1 hypothetical protein [Candidatus Nanoarchaeia archaeon]